MVVLCGWWLGMGLLERAPSRAPILIWLAPVPHMHIPHAPQLKAMKGNWRAKHESFISAMRGGKQSGGGGGQQEEEGEPQLPSGYVSCEHCGRSFNEDAGKRHIPVCGKSKQKEAWHRRPPAGPTSLKGGARGGGGNGLLSASTAGAAAAPVSREELMRKRTSFKPPTPRTKPSTAASAGAGGARVSR